MFRRFFAITSCAVLLHIGIGCTESTPSDGRPESADAPNPVDDTGLTDWVATELTATEGSPCTQRPNAWPMQRWTDSTWGAQTVTPESSPFPTSAWGLAVSDYDGDGLLDIYLPQLGTGELYLNMGSRAFREVSATHLPDETVTALAATAVDLDGDGDIDIAESGFGMVRLLLNDGSARFAAHRPTDPEPTTLYLGSSWADMDGDGDLDGIIAASPSTVPTMAEREDPAHLPGAADILLEAIDGEWRDVSSMLPATNDGHTFLAGWHDLNNDRQPELLIMNDYFITGQTNRVWTYDPMGFNDVSDAYGLNQGMESMGLAVTDANGDQRPDLLVTGWGELAWMVSDPNGGAWIDRRAADGYVVATETGQWVGWGAEFADLDNDQQEEAVVSFGFWELAGEGDDPDQVNAVEQPDAVFAMHGDVVQDDAATWGIDDRTYGRGMVVADIDRDGRVDLIRRPVFGPATIDSPECTSNRWATVSLRQSGPNPFAIGAMVHVRTDKEQTRWVRAGGTGLAGGGPAEVHFGLGQHESIDQIAVTWPDGKRSVHEATPSDRHVVITRD